MLIVNSHLSSLNPPFAAIDQLPFAFSLFSFLFLVPFFLSNLDHHTPRITPHLIAPSRIVLHRSKHQGSMLLVSPRSFYPRLVLAQRAPQGAKLCQGTVCLISLRSVTGEACVEVSSAAYKHGRTAANFHSPNLLPGARLVHVLLLPLMQHASIVLAQPALFGFVCPSGFSDVERSS